MFRKATGAGTGYQFGTTVQGITAPNGMTEVLDFEASNELSTVVAGKNSLGDILAMLFGGEKHSGSLSGYASGNLPSLGTQMSIKGANIFSTKNSIRGSAEDFTKISIEGQGAPSLA